MKRERDACVFRALVQPKPTEATEGQRYNQRWQVWTPPHGHRRRADANREDRTEGLHQGKRGRGGGRASRTRRTAQPLRPRSRRHANALMWAAPCGLRLPVCRLPSLGPEGRHGPACVAARPPTLVWRFCVSGIVCRCSFRGCGCSHALSVGVGSGGAAVSGNLFRAAVFSSPSFSLVSTLLVERGQWPLVLTQLDEYTRSLSCAGSGPSPANTTTRAKSAATITL